MNIHEYCKYFRTFILRKTLKEMKEYVEDVLDVDVSTSSISSFENGRSTNLKYLYYYYNMCNNEEQKQRFKNSLPLEKE